MTYCDMMVAELLNNTIRIRYVRVIILHELMISTKY